MAGTRTRGSEYERLRAEYDRAFARLCAAQPSTDHGSEDTLRLEKALAAYRLCRQRLARFLAATEGGDGEGDDVRNLAHHFWEQAGRPSGKAEQHWHAAEAVVRDARQ